MQGLQDEQGIKADGNRASSDERNGRMKREEINYRCVDERSKAGFVNRRCKLRDNTAGCMTDEKASGRKQ